MENQVKYSTFRSFYTFYSKEVKRFIKVWGQTVLGPIITTTLFLLVFSVAVSNNASRVLPQGISYSQFLIPGLTMMAIIQNAFSNTSSSLIIAKVSGTIIDTLMSPLSTWQTIVALTLGAITRGILIGAIILLYSMLFINLPIHSMGWMIYYAFAASMFLGLLGIIAGIVCQKFDHVANFMNLFITPMSFLSGTFYSTKQLPGAVQHIVHYNPFFYMIDGFRYSFIGVADFSITIGALVLLIINAILFFIAWLMWKKGYKIKN